MRNRPVVRTCRGYPPKTNGPAPPGSAVTNAFIADVFDEIGDLLELEEANPFRIRAYRNAARLLRGLGDEVSAMLAEGKALDDLPGIGTDLAQKIEDIVNTGTTSRVARLRREVPHGLTKLLKLPGLGPKRVKLIDDELGVENSRQLHRAAKDGRLRAFLVWGRRPSATSLRR